MSRHLSEQEMARREMDLCEYMCSPGEAHSLECEQYREAHAALRAEREETATLRQEVADRDQTIKRCSEETKRLRAKVAGLETADAPASWYDRRLRGLIEATQSLPERVALQREVERLRTLLERQEGHPGYCCGKCASERQTDRRLLERCRSVIEWAQEMDEACDLELADLRHRLNPILRDLDARLGGSDE